MGFGARKASIAFFGGELAKLGWQTDLVTAQLSYLSVLAGVPRLKKVPYKQRNTWIKQTDRLSSFVWLPPFHPATSRNKLTDWMATPLFYLYPYLLPETIRRRVRSSVSVRCGRASAFVRRKPVG